MVNHCSPTLVECALVIYENLSGVPNIPMVVMVMTFIISIAVLMHLVAMHVRLIHIF